MAVLKKRKAKPKKILHPFICEPCGYKCKSENLESLMALQLAHKKGQHKTKLIWFLGTDEK